MVAFSKRYFSMSKRPKKGASIPILWPVYLYKVIYPEPSEDKTLNLFQQAILAFFRAGCDDTAQIAQLLDLNRELVVHIISTQLEPNGWLSEEYKVIPEGERLLDRDEAIKNKLKVGYAFKDCNSKLWMPRMLGQLNEIEPESIQNNFPEFLMERGKGQKLCPFVIRNHQNKPSEELSSKVLFKAYRDYRLDMHHARQLEIEIDDSASIHHLDSIDFINNEPEPVYLLTWIYSDSNTDEPWSIADPFGIRTSASWLRPTLKNLISKNKEPELSRRLKNLLKNEPEDNQSPADWLEQLEQNARVEILLDYPELAKHELISRYLTSLIRRLSAVEEEVYSKDDIDILLVNSQQLIESILQWMLKKWPAEENVITRKTRWRKDQASGLFQQLNLDCLNTDAIDRLKSQNSCGIVKAILYGNGSMRDLLCAILLTTTSHQQHPFKVLQGEKIVILTLLDLGQARNKSGHASQETTELGEAISLSRFAINWTKNFKEWF